MRSAPAEARFAAPAWARCLVLVAALLALFAWPLTRVHEATVQHAICPEHGELVDVADERHSASHEVGERWTAGAQDDEEHGHCPFLALGQPGEPASLPVHAAARPVCVLPPRTPGSETRFVSVPLLCLAPKQSPPIEPEI